MSAERRVEATAVDRASLAGRKMRARSRHFDGREENGGVYNDGDAKTTLMAKVGACGAHRGSSLARRAE